MPAEPLRLRGAEAALHATLAAAAPHQRNRVSVAGRSLTITADDLRRQRREQPAGRTILFVVDSSGSMGARRRMVAVKGAILSLLLDAHRRRDRVGLVAFRGLGAEVLLSPTASLTLARRQLANLPTGGATPFAHGLMRARQVLTAERRRRPRAQSLLVVLSDGRANVSLRDGIEPTAEVERALRDMHHEGIDGVLLDTEDGPVRLGNMGRFGVAWVVPCFPLTEVRAEGIGEAVRRMLRGS